jgi:phosphoribosyl 1,2-cyclic phosphodiesterase/DNA-binding response OmpR family regulator
MHLQFWGTRGSIPKPGPTTLRYGGNTSCVALRSAAGTLLVLDCGTGAHELGREIVTTTTRPRSGHLLFTHTHWDHVQGFPFFLPLFQPDAHWHIYGPRGLGESLKDTLTGQMRDPYFPISMKGIGAQRSYHELVEGRFEIEDLRITTRFLNHPALTVGYRIEVDGFTVVYATDHEPHERRFASGIHEPLTGEDLEHAHFVSDADLLIHDAQYIATEYPQRMGWGHSTHEYVIDLALGARVRRLALFHHDPWRSDEALARLEAAARRRVADHGSSMEVFAAAEGQVFDMVGREDSPRRHGALAPLDSLPAAVIEHQVLVVSSDPSTTAMLVDAVRANGFTPLVADNAEEAMMRTSSSEPPMVLIDDTLPAPGAFALCRRLRETAEGAGAERAILLVLKGGTEDGRAKAAKAGATDVMEKPFTPAYARARIAAGVLRMKGRWQAAPIPDDEAERLAALVGMKLLDSPPDERLDRLTRLATDLLNVPVSALTLIDRDRQCFKSVHGLDGADTSRDVAFCAHTILENRPLVIPDAFLDDRFAENPLVLAPPGIRFYAGVPICAATGDAIGSFCVIDYRPRELSPAKLELFEALAKMAQEELLRGVEDGQAGEAGQAIP